jgi:hypothetical protein
MRNAWLDELSIKRAVRMINAKLRINFVGKSDDMKQFSKLIIESLSSYDARIRDSIAQKYNLETTTEQGTVSDIKLVKLPWLL